MPSSAAQPSVGIMVGLSSTVLLTLNSGRTALYIYNDSPLEVVYLSLDGALSGTPGSAGGAAHVGRGIRLNPNGDSWWTVTTAEGSCYTGAVTAISAGLSAGLAVVTFTEI